MSQYNTNAAKQIVYVLQFQSVYKQMMHNLENLNAEILDENAVDNLRAIARSMQPHVDDLEKSLYKLLD